MSILPECLAFLGNLLSLIIFGILFQEITKNKLSIAEWGDLWCWLSYMPKFFQCVDASFFEDVNDFWERFSIAF